MAEDYVVDKVLGKIEEKKMIVRFSWKVWKY